MPSWISRATRRRSSAVAIERTSSKTSAVSSRRLWSSTLGISSVTVSGSGLAGPSATSTPIIRVPTRSGSTARCRRQACPTCRMNTAGSISAQHRSMPSSSGVMSIRALLPQ